MHEKQTSDRICVELSKDDYKYMRKYVNDFVRRPDRNRNKNVREKMKMKIEREEKGKKRRKYKTF